ncbi:thiamine diphosphokinase [Paenibacillus endoradicis]|uniref:thiamine diphosphokinase n=1 Tax=Paenibacillus endoradicis TaxID=2972487 RepID=UPI002158FFB1|nr:thiamine diphosphokinase [Paenibacillus endoradicis]MCR8656829.1 thiamine diphosphokinase [Paenibacillus endoradicis]
MQSQISIICSGGQLGEWALPYINQEHYLIGADRGAQFLLDNGFTPNISIGDFDSVTKEQYHIIQQKSKEILSFDAIDKDYTDTELSFLHAIERGSTEIILLGGLGTRFDHSLGNIQLLSLALQKDIKACLIDAHNRIQLMQDSLHVIRDHYHYVSLLPYSEVVTGITLEGFKYPLHDATIKKGESIGVSNELIDSEGTIHISSGQLLVIQSND